MNSSLCGQPADDDAKGQRPGNGGHRMLTHALLGFLKKRMHHAVQLGYLALETLQFLGGRGNSLLCLAGKLVRAAITLAFEFAAQFIKFFSQVLSRSHRASPKVNSKCPRRHDSHVSLGWH